MLRSMENKFEKSYMLRDVSTEAMVTLTQEFVGMNRAHTVPTLLDKVCCDTADGMLHICHIVAVVWQ